MFDFSKVVDRHGTWCTQWDYVADRFGTADLLPFTISDMDFATAPCIIEALNQRLMHGVFGYKPLKTMSFWRGYCPLVFHPALHRHRFSDGGVWPFCHLYGFRTDSSVV